MAAVFVSFKKKPSMEEIKERWASFSGPAQELNLPSAPKQFLHYFEEADRPQTKLDRNLEHGMAVSIGRLRRTPSTTISLCACRTTRFAALPAAAYFSQSFLLRRDTLTDNSLSARSAFTRK